jgi:hypothetical protein
MKTENWIDDRNLIPVVEAISRLCNYKFDDWDKDVIETAMKKVDEDRNIWFDSAPVQTVSKTEFTAILTVVVRRTHPTMIIACC